MLTSDDLFLRRNRFISLEYEITQRSREGEVTIHAIELHPASSGKDSLCLKKAKY